MRVAIIIVLALVAGVGIWSLELRRRRLPSALAARPDLTLAEIQIQFYRDLSLSPEHFARLWNDVAEAFETPAGRIRPTDRLGVELSSRPLFGITDDDFILAGMLRRRCKELGVEAPKTKPKTVDEYIRLVAGTTPSPRPSSATT